MTHPGAVTAPDVSRTRHPRLATALAVLCVLALAAAIWAALWVRSASAEDRAADRDRAAALQAAERFTETWNTFEPDAVDAYLAEVGPLLSSTFRTQFEEAADNVTLGIEQQRLSSTGTVLEDGDGVPLVAVAALDDDSAEVLVVSDARRVSSGQEVLRHWRWQVSLVKVDGEWLVDAFEEV